MSTPDELALALSIIVANARLAEDPQMGGITDAYLVPADNIEAARALLEAEGARVRERLARYCWSTDGEGFVGRFETRAEALEEGRDYARDDDLADDRTTFWTARCVEPPELLKLHGRNTIRNALTSLIENLDEDIGSEIGAEDEVVSLSVEKAPIVEAAIEALLIEHLDTGHWYGVADVEEHTVEPDA